MLDNGLYLEESAVVIPWGATAKGASAVGSPRVLEHYPRFDIVWGPEAVLGGMEASIHAVLHGSQRLRELQIQPSWTTEPYVLKAHYEYVRDHLTRVLGAPRVSSAVHWESMPSYTWDGDGDFEVRLFLFDRFGEQLMLRVTHKGKLPKRSKLRNNKSDDVEEPEIPVTRSKLFTQIFVQNKKRWAAIRSILQSRFATAVMKFFLIPLLIVLVSLLFVHWGLQQPTG